MSCVKLTANRLGGGISLHASRLGQGILLTCSGVCAVSPVRPPDEAVILMSLDSPKLISTDNFILCGVSEETENKELVTT